MRKLNLKQPKYIFPLVIFLPLTFFAYEISSVFDGGNTTTGKVATDSLNMALPDAENSEMKNKMAGMEYLNMGADGYSAIGGFGEDEEQKDSLGNAYSEDEMNQIDKDNAERQAQQKAQEEMERSLAESRKHINSYANGGYNSYNGGGRVSSRNSTRSRQDELDDYAKELEYIQKRSRAAEKAVEDNFREDNGYNGGSYDDYDVPSYGYRNGQSQRPSYSSKNKKTKKEEKPQTVEKVQSQNADKFNTVTVNKCIDSPLIKAVIDKSTKAHEGTRLRFKLLDDVTINIILLKKVHICMDLLQALVSNVYLQASQVFL